MAVSFVRCCRVQAITRMKDQPAGGHVFNMDGAGADGNATPRFAAYGATKRSLQQVRGHMHMRCEVHSCLAAAVRDGCCLVPGMEGGSRSASL